MPNRRSRSRGLAPAAALGAAILLLGGCNRLGNGDTPTADTGAGASQAAQASQLVGPDASAPTESAGPTHGPLPTFDANLGSLDDALAGTNNALGAANGADSEGNLK